MAMSEGKIKVWEMRNFACVDKVQVVVQPAKIAFLALFQSADVCALWTQGIASLICLNRFFRWEYKDHEKPAGAD